LILSNILILLKIVYSDNDGSSFKQARNLLVFEYFYVLVVHPTEVVDYNRDIRHY